MNPIPFCLIHGLSFSAEDLGGRGLGFAELEKRTEDLRIIDSLSDKISERRREKTCAVG